MVWPYELLPQQLTPPDELSEQVWLPVVTATWSERATVGTVDSPKMLLPQHVTAPDELKEHVWAVLKAGGVRQPSGLGG